MQLTVMPSKQGDLDNFCGIYSLVNALSYLYQGAIKRKLLKMALLEAYGNKWPLDELVYCGMEGDELAYLINEVLMCGYYSRYPIKITRPFAKVRPPNIQAVLDRIQRFLFASPEPHTRIVLVTTKEHWTLIYHIDATFIYLFDSCGQKRAYRRSFSLRSRKKGHVLVVRETIFIERG